MAWFVGNTAWLRRELHHASDVSAGERLKLAAEVEQRFALVGGLAEGFVQGGDEAVGKLGLLADGGRVLTAQQQADEGERLAGHILDVDFGFGVVGTVLKDRDGGQSLFDVAFDVGEVVDHGARSPQGLCLPGMFHVKRPGREREWNADSLYGYGLRLLTYRARSEREVRQRFQQRGAAPDLADAVVERLRHGGLIDDEAFAEAWVDSRRRAAPRGDRLLKQELARKGVARATIDAALGGDADAQALARQAAAKKARALASEPEPVFVRRLTDFLLRRGFEYETVAGVVRELAAEREQASG